MSGPDHKICADYGTTSANEGEAAPTDKAGQFAKPVAERGVGNQ